MSTYWGYVCESHDPPLISEHWINHGEEVLIETFFKVRAGEWPDDPRMPDLGEPLPVVFYASGYGSSAPVWWLGKHPHCAVSLHNEYGERREIRELARGSVIRAIE